jgi:hypothetical protein
MKGLTYGVEVTVHFADLTLEDTAKLERYLRDGLSGQKGFKRLRLQLMGDGVLEKPGKAVDPLTLGVDKK